jgi:hypothetical protein
MLDSTAMGKLTEDQIGIYFSVHLPYRTRILLAHYRMTRTSWTGDLGQLEACFEASLITGRMFLNVLGISRNPRDDELIRKKFRDDEVNVEDLGGNLVDPAKLASEDTALFRGFLKMADKAAAHLTTPMEHPWPKTHEAITRICHHLKANLYDHTARISPDIAAHLASR